MKVPHLISSLFGNRRNPAPRPEDAIWQASADDVMLHEDSDQETSAVDQSEEQETTNSEADPQQAEITELPPEILLAQNDMPLEGFALENTEESGEKEDDGDSSSDSSTSIGSTGGFFNVLLAGLGLGAVAAAAGGGGGGGNNSSAPVSTNQSPTGIALDNTSVAENADAAVIGNLTVTDPDDPASTDGQHTFAVNDVRFEVVGGQLKLKSGSTLDHETEPTVDVTVTATDGGGLSTSQLFSITVNDVYETTSLTGTDNADTFGHATGLDDFVIDAQAGNDTIQTGSGNDMVRPGEGADTVTTGAGNDVIVVAGETTANQYEQSDIDNPGGSGINLSSLVTLADLNGRAVSEVVSGESIDGGAGTNRLIIYGNVDLTGVTLTNVTQLQVNSTVTISAQQINALDLTVIYGDGESVLNITNEGSDSVTVDLSGMTLADFRTLDVGANVTVIADQADVDSLHNLSGEGVIRASTDTDTLDLTGKYVSLAVHDKDGTVDAAHGGGNHVAGDLLVGSESADTLTGGASDDRIEGGAGNDILTGGDGNDVLRGGAGVDTMDGGAGDDTFVIVGDLSAGGKVDSNADTAALGFPLTDLNGQDLNEDEDGATEIIRGGDGEDTLYVYGTADLSNYDITGVEHVEIRSRVTFDMAFFTSVQTLTGDGSSTISVGGGSASDPVVIDLSDIRSLQLDGIGQIDLGEHVILEVDSLDQLGGAQILTGNGTVRAKTGSISLSDDYVIQSGLSVENANGTSAQGSAEVLESVIQGVSGGPILGGSGDDYLIGTTNRDIFDGGGGNDVFAGEDGDDIFEIHDDGEKIILDSAGIDTLDFSEAGSPADIDLTDGDGDGIAGTVGGANVQLGAVDTSAAAQQGATKFNVMLIMDVSGSMYGSLLSETKQAAYTLLDAYDDLGDVSVRLVTFESSASIVGGWMDNSAAQSAIGALSANWWGGTNYQAALNTAQSAFSGWDSEGTNVSYFLSDGEPNDGYEIDSSRETSWENFLIENQILSHAVGFGGLSSTNALEPIAFDGIKVSSPSDDHTPGEISATLTPDIIDLGETLVAQAQLDFIENVIGTEYDDTLVGNSLDNEIKGGLGDDTLEGGEGNDTLLGELGCDTVIYSGNESDYQVRKNNDGTWQVTDNNLSDGDDGNDTLVEIESIKFGDTPNDAPVSLVAQRNTRLTSEVDTNLSNDLNEPYIDGTTAVIADYVRAIAIDETDNQVHKWDLEADNIITYSFMVGDAYGNVQPSIEWRTNSHTDKPAMTAIEAALGIFERFIPIDFQEVCGSSENADFRFYLADQNWFGDPDILGMMMPPNYGDNTGWAYDAGTMVLKEQQDWTFGNDNYETLIHELGHGLGLSHPHNDGSGDDAYFPAANGPWDDGSYELNDYVYTMMSYISNYNDEAPDPNENEPMTPMPLDVFALQEMYGSNGNYNAGNNTYYLKDAIGNYYETIWDTGIGTDTISYENESGDVVIDLRAADFSTLTAEVDDYSDLGYFGYFSMLRNDAQNNLTAHDSAARNDPSSHNHSDNGGFVIASGVTIENAIGGVGDDKIIGNEAANVLEGGSGRDTFVFGSVSEANGDTIEDFMPGYDEIDMSGIDSLVWSAGGLGVDQAFTYSTTAPEIGSPNKILWFDDATEELNGWLDFGSNAMSTNPDFEIFLPGVDSIALGEIPLDDWFIV